MPSGCIEWTGYVMPNGYGQIKVSQKKYLAHRWSYQLSFGEIPEGMCICHRCDNRKCINPDHLFVGTNYDNILDRMKKDRSVRTKKQGNGVVKLTEQQVLDIRKDPRHYALIATDYGLTPQHARRIQRGINWKWLK
jgi:hypothetical protein